MTNETMEYDVVIIGAGPSGLATAIKLKQLANLHNKELMICILEKGAKVGSHILSGAVIEPYSLKQLLPDSWHNAPLNTPVIKDTFKYLTKKHAFTIPTPRPMQNDGNFIISLGELCQFLATEAQNLGCEIYPGFSATEILYDKNNNVIGVATSDLGLDKNNHKTPNYQPGIHILAEYTIFAEGCRGQLSQELMHKFDLRKNINPQTYGLGIKELWQVPDCHKQGHVIHTIGWPLDNQTYGGSFIYHLSKNTIAIGFVIGLDYKNPWLNPFCEFQRFKTHPYIKPILLNGERIGYGARALNEGGYQSLPKLIFPGGLLIGDAAGFLNVPKIKGTHLAIQSGIIAAETIFEELLKPSPRNIYITNYANRIKKSKLMQELYKSRNIRPGFKFGLKLGLLNAAFETYITHGCSPWTLSNHDDYKSIINASIAKKIDYPKPDGIITFDKLSSIYLSNITHEENQPCHIKLIDKNKAIDVNYQQYASPETRYCPANVYEIIELNNNKKLQINSQNCIHCKTCDIKDPTQNIIWTSPVGGSGPNYIDM